MQRQNKSTLLEILIDLEQTSHSIKKHLAKMDSSLSSLQKERLNNAYDNNEVENLVNEGEDLRDEIKIKYDDLITTINSLKTILCKTTITNEKMSKVIELAKKDSSKYDDFIEESKRTLNEIRSLQPKPKPKVVAQPTVNSSNTPSLNTPLITPSSQNTSTLQTKGGGNTTTAQKTKLTPPKLPASKANSDKKQTIAPPKIIPIKKASPKRTTK